jgi:hypothetical protein
VKEVLPPKRPQSRAVNVSLIEMKGLSAQFDQDQFKRYFRDRGYHMVYAKKNCNPVSNEATGEG